MNRKIVPMEGSSISSAQKLWHAWQGIWYADGLAHTLDSLRIYSLPDISGDWVKTLSGRAAMLNQEGAGWHGIRKDLASPMLSAIISYDNNFSVLNDHLSYKKDMDADAIVSYLENLYAIAKDNATGMRKIKQEFDSWNQDVLSTYTLMEQSMAEGWAALDVEEASVSRLTAEIAVVQNTLEEVQAQIMPSALKKEGKFAKTFGKIVYSAMIAGKPVSYLSAGGLFYSVGATFYEVVSGYKKIKDAVEKLQESKMEFNLRQQALAQTKSLIQFLQQLELRVAALDNEFDDIVDLWDDEKKFLGNKLSSIRDGADPKKLNLVVEAASWETLSQYAQKFLGDDYRSDSFDLTI